MVDNRIQAGAMDTNARPMRIGSTLLAGIFAIVATFAGSASVSDWRAPAGVTPTERMAATGEAVGDPQTDAPAAADDLAPPIRLPVGRTLRRHTNCASCGVVESVSRIDRRGPASFVCSSNVLDRLWMGAVAEDGGEPGGASPLSDIVEGVLTGRAVERSVIIASRYQIVVRFRDGSRRVFDEATARALRSGERIQVIAGMKLPSQ
jgi:hypothetical protein